MGVPALFRWLTRKYPKIVQNITEAPLPDDDGPPDFTGPNPNGFEVDSLYLDMNGIIHPCCHPQDKPAPPTENDMMKAVFKYLDRIMAMVRPRRLLYLAVDGVAPRAKMNQQRSRRFRAAKDAQEKRESREASADVDSEQSASFDSNVITPGTPFMQLVSDSLRYYIAHRMNAVPAWQNVKVILSDWTVPGEGEHKIVDFIRRQRLDPEYDANQEHVIYGLDADLIMLTMATHEIRWRVLREDVFWEEEQKRGQCRNCLQPGHFASDCPNPVGSPKEDPHMIKPFIYLNIAVLREYLLVEFKPDSQQFPFDPDRAIDDWVFLCFLVGNDFLPHVPSLELREGAIDTLMDIYKSNADALGGHLTKDGRVNMERVWVIFKELARVEQDILRRRKEREDRREESSKRRRVQQGDLPQVVVQAIDLNSNAVLGSKRTAPDEIAEAVDEVRLHEPGARSRYYTAKFGKDPKDHPDFVAGVCRSYLEGLNWVMGYYYQGCPSWKWFYPYHYAPFAADFCEFLDERDAIWRQELKFDLGKPFRPYDQLMSVFPVASKEHLPEPFQRLMTDSDSELLEYYPDDFAVDLNGKKQAWQGIALLPFIDEDRLLRALERVYPALDEKQLRLNRKSHDLLYVYESSTLFAFLCTIDTDEEGIWPLDVLLSKGLSGSVRCWTESPSPDAAIPVPFEGLPTVDSNKVVAAHYYPPGVSGQESFMHMHFPARTLPRARPLPPCLSAEERNAVRSGRPYSRDSREHSMNRDWAQRQEERSVFQKPSYPSSTASHGDYHSSRSYSGSKYSNRR